MNPRMILRAIDRHRSMLDLKGYEIFLEDMAREERVWRVTQRDFARWWIRREAAVVRFKLQADGVLVESDLSDACIQCEDGRVVSLPTVLPGEVIDERRPVIEVEPRFVDIARRLCRHFGCGHIEIRAGADRDPIGLSLTSVLEGFGRASRDAKRYPEDRLDAVRQALIEASARAGFPWVCIWGLPAADGRPYRCAFSPRFDVDKAIVNMPRIAALQNRFDVVGTFYLRPVGLFYGAREIERWRHSIPGNELALHGEFVTTAETMQGTESEAARHEKQKLERLLGEHVVGVCIHGGELRTNLSPRTAAAIDEAGFEYETTSYDRPYTRPFYMPNEDATHWRTALTMIRQQDDVTVPLTSDFPTEMARRFRRDLDVAIEQGGVFVPTMHPLYFGVGNYLRYPENVARLIGFVPVFLRRAMQMKSGNVYVNQEIRRG